VTNDLEKPARFERQGKQDHDAARMLHSIPVYEVRLVPLRLALLLAETILHHPVISGHAQHDYSARSCSGLLIAFTRKPRLKLEMWKDAAASRLLVLPMAWAGSVYARMLANTRNSVLV
jgi:hypothetical protein